MLPEKDKIEPCDPPNCRPALQFLCRRFSDAAFAGSARSRRQSVIWSFGSAPPIRESSGYESPAAAHLAGSDRIPD